MPITSCTILCPKANTTCHSLSLLNNDDSGLDIEYNILLSLESWIMVHWKRYIYPLVFTQEKIVYRK